MKLFAFGLGYSASVIGAAVRQRGWLVSGTARSSENLLALERKGFYPVLFADSAAVSGALAEATHILVSIPPVEAGDPVLSACGEALESAPHLKWAGYLSTIGVYGDFKGAWVEEETPAEPATRRGVARLAAEEAWSSFCGRRTLSLDIFRLAGIYGPGRTPFAKIESGEARRIIKPGHVSNRIHVDDIARTVTAAMLQPGPEGGARLFNVADDEPAPPQDVILYAAQLIGARPPPEIGFEDAGLSPVARSFYAGSKRIQNGKIKRELGIKLEYPTYREGLRALARGRSTD
jgi:nucleoside-diphosphate-sugar epimerase